MKNKYEEYDNINDVPVEFRTFEVCKKVLARAMSFYDYSVKCFFRSVEEDRDSYGFTRDQYIELLVVAGRIECVPFEFRTFEVCKKVLPKNQDIYVEEFFQSVEEDRDSYGFTRDQYIELLIIAGSINDVPKEFRTFEVCKKVLARSEFEYVEEFFQSVEEDWDSYGFTSEQYDELLISAANHLYELFRAGVLDVGLYESFDRIVTKACIKESGLGDIEGPFFLEETYYNGQWRGGIVAIEYKFALDPRFLGYAIQCGYKQDVIDYKKSIESDIDFLKREIKWLEEESDLNSEETKRIEYYKNNIEEQKGELDYVVNVLEKSNDKD